MFSIYSKRNNVPFPISINDAVEFSSLYIAQPYTFSFKVLSCLEDY